MYALPEQTLAMAEHDLHRAFALAPTHISHYQLTIEPNTLFAARVPAGIPDDDMSYDIQEHCQALLAAHGYAQYEVSAYARDGNTCAHNLNYWRRSEEHTSELQSLMRISYSDFGLKKKNTQSTTTYHELRTP